MTPAGPSPEALYQEQILEHYRHPHHKGTLPHADGAATVHNTLCGEDVTVSVTLDRSGAAARVREVGFTGQGCSLSQASASMMTDLVPGLSESEIGQLVERLTQLVHGDRSDDDAVGPLRAFSIVSRVPARTRCVLLAWEALARALRAAAGPEARHVATGHSSSG